MKPPGPETSVNCDMASLSHMPGLLCRIAVSPIYVNFVARIAPAEGLSIYNHVQALACCRRHEDGPELGQLPAWQFMG